MTTPGKPTLDLPLAAVSSADACCPPGPDMIPRDEATRIAALFKALSDPVRVQLLRHIAGAEQGTACACHLPDALGISQPTLSHHLRKLTDAGLVTREQRGRWAHYTVQPATVGRIEDFLSATRDAGRG